MTTEQTTHPVSGAELVETPQTKALVLQAVDQVLSGKISLAELFDALSDRPRAEVKPAPPLPVSRLSEDQMAALKRLPEVYGKVVPTSNRKLTQPELATLVEERDVIDTILGITKKRKDESIRETLANHFDSLLSDEEREVAVQDAKGHWAVKQEAPAEGTGRKVQRIVSGGKPNLTISHVEALNESGAIDRKTYLLLTKKPDSPRVLDEHGIAETIKKNPSLAFLLAAVAEPTTPMTTIKVVNDN